MKTLIRLTIAACLLAGPASAFAILGDDEAETARKYGQPVQTTTLYDCPAREYICKGYDIVVIYVDGHSASESISRKEGLKVLAPNVIQGFLKAHAAGKTWRQKAGLSTGPRWERDGAQAFYSTDAKGAQLMVMAEGFLARVEADAPTPAPPAPPAPVVATIKGTGDKTSDPFEITSADGFTVEYQHTGPYLGVHVRAKGQKREVAFSSLNAAGKDHTFIAAGPGTYYIEITATTGEYIITVRE